MSHRKIELSGCTFLPDTQLAKLMSTKRKPGTDRNRTIEHVNVYPKSDQRERDLAEINQIMMEQQKEHESELRKQSAVVQQAAQKLQEERNRKLAAYDDVEKLQLKLDESRCVQSSLGNYSPRGLATPVKLASRPKEGAKFYV